MLGPGAGRVKGELRRGIRGLGRGLTYIEDEEKLVVFKPFGWPAEFVSSYH